MSDNSPIFSFHYLVIILKMINIWEKSIEDMHKHDGITYMFVVFVLQKFFQLIQILLRANIAINECLQTKKKVVELL